MWIDSHAHLYEYTDHDLERLLDKAHSESVTLIISTAVSIDTSHKVCHQCNNFKELLGTVGISPFDVYNLSPMWFSELSSLLNNKKIVAIGEIGIDGSNPRYPPLELQVPIFEKQLQLAVNQNIPAVIHSRGVEMKALEICRKNGVRKAVFHCFTGDQQSLIAIISEGYTISLSGIVTFKHAPIRELLPLIPLEQLLIETDSPYLTPIPFRGQKNTPSMVRIIGEFIAREYMKDPIEIADQIKTNVKKLFNVS